jgi:hypothetical protein
MNLGLHETIPLCFANQSIPRITSMPVDSKIVMSAVNNCPSKTNFTPLHSNVLLFSPSGELVKIGLGRGLVRNDLFLTNLVEIYENGAPVSNTTVAKTESIRNLPSAMSGTLQHPRW